MNVTINLSLSEEERNSRRCIHIGVSGREWERVSSKIDAILRYHSCLFFALCFNLDPLIEIKYIYAGCENVKLENMGKNLVKDLNKRYHQKEMKTENLFLQTLNNFL